MNNETINAVAQKGSYTNFFALPDSVTAIASKASFGAEVTAFQAHEIPFDEYVVTASVNVNGIAADKKSFKQDMANQWDIINGDARPWARNISETVLNQVKDSGSAILHLPDAESYAYCENEWTLLDPLVGTVGFPAILTHPLLATAKTATAKFKDSVGAPEAAHDAQNVAKKALTETCIPQMKVHYTNFDDLAKSMAATFPDFAKELERLNKEGHSGIQHRGFTINAKNSTDGSLLRNVKIEFPDYVNPKAPEFTNSLGNTPLITMLIGQWEVKCSIDGFQIHSFKPIFIDNDVAHFEILFVPIP